ncbi:vitamin B12 ABC transporter permease BtuC [Vibrio salinus]|uniref:vitamin B12 ABC transporter permease BtuC n=1 Tax=Vibrio salinus TaxID=2899784 RepID=UPI001E2C8BDC|nr:vitamin B12 ABC transporter permease BtuC [Vibrio salinus]MCE0496305.1 vitamin B12 ABC transporter permease BtuC [Vibrio salinus]
MDFYQLTQRQRQKWLKAICLFFITLIVFSFVYLMFGEVFISPLSPKSSFEIQLITDLRLPRLLAAIMIGAALSLSGATLQILLGNGLAEPGIIGVSGGASVAMVILLFIFPMFATPVGFMISAIMGALLFTFILVAIARAMRLTTARLLLVGVAMGILASSVVTWFFYFSDDLSLRLLIYWLMGSISGVTWKQHWISLIMFPAVIWVMSKGNLLDRLMLGEVHARQLGIDVYKVRWQLIIAVAVLVGGSVALGGIIGFIGLIVPHLLRLAFGSENRYLLPLTAISGALLLVMADLLARTLLDSAELPLGVVTTTIGAPVFVWMLLKNHDTY